MNNNIISLNQSKVFIGIDLAKKIHVAKAVDINGTVHCELHQSCALNCALTCAIIKGGIALATFHVLM